MPELLMPPSRARIRQAFVPYVYTRAEVHALLKATVQNQAPGRKVDRRTLRTFILSLYGTGALVGEMLNLKHGDIDLKTGLIHIRSRSSCRDRRIPIGSDMKDVFQIYIKWRIRMGFRNDHLFVSQNDLPLSPGMVNVNFQRLRQFAGVSRSDGGIYQPRLFDLKYTFAVHRITSWIRNGADLNRMLPALAAYMGQSGLGGTERYLHMTPERFRKDLNKLSPGRANGRWRNNKPLMKFIATL